MAKVRKIFRHLAEGRNYFVIDACFLVNKYIPLKCIPVAEEEERERVKRCQEWWEEIDQQLDSDKARVYIPDICIAEAFKTLAKKYYDKKLFKANDYNHAKKRLSEDITTKTSELRKPKRQIKYHDISTSRDLIISVDRFFEVFLKNNPSVSIPDLIVLTTAKYLMDFYDLPSKRIHIVTCDDALRKGTKGIYELAYVYDPTKPEDARDKVFTA